MTADEEVRRYAASARRGARAIGPVRWLEELERRRDELEAALESVLERVLCEPVGANEREGACDIVLALAVLWRERGRSAEGLRWCRRVLERLSGGEVEPVRGDLAAVAAWAVTFEINLVHDQAHRRRLCERFDRLMQDAHGDDDAVLAVCEASVSAARRSHHYEAVARHCAAGIAAAERAADAQARAAVSVWLAMAQHQLGLLDDAARTAASALAQARIIASRSLTAYALMVLAQLPTALVRAYGVVPTMQQAVDSARRSADPGVLADVLPAAAADSLMRGDLDAAADAVEEALRIADRAQMKDLALASLMLVVAWAVACGDDVVAANVAGALADHRELLEQAVPQVMMVGYVATVDGVRRRLGDAAFDRHATQGGVSTWAEAVSGAIDVLARRQSTPQASRHALLTERELQVLARLAAGRSNKQIAAELGISVKTAMHHTSNLYRKLRVRGRVEAVAYAHRYGLTPDAHDTVP